MMAAPTDYAQRVSGEPREDCRDYLRTGRCKYGVSCKYNHPPNVQSGGGMKGPIDPSEPLFPIRPNEPPCQYYLKHGTCKFGQACKFHHPPQSVRSAIVGGTPVVMNVGTGRNGETGLPQTFLVNSLAPEHGLNASSMSLQFLPQRPDEADCIYFLRNGRCKYGATCRYHHPVSVQHRKQVDPSYTRNQHSLQVHVSTQDVQRSPMNARNRSRSMSEMRTAPVQFVSQQPSSSSFGQHGYLRNTGSSVGGATHILVADGPVSFVTMSGANDVSSLEATQSHHQGFSSVPTSPVVTSVASSYETAGSGGDSSSASWNRPSRTPSGGSLSALAAAESTGQAQSQYVLSGNRVSLSTSASDTNIAGRYRSVSTQQYGGQFGDASEYHVASNPGWAVKGHGPQTVLASNRESSQIGVFEQQSKSRGDPKSHSATVSRAIAGYYQDAPIHNRANPSSTSNIRGSGRKQSHRQRQPSEFDDDGLSMMTSALLTMLDTPEEGSGSVPSENLSAADDEVPSFSGQKVFADEKGPGTLSATSSPGRSLLSQETIVSLPVEHEHLGSNNMGLSISPRHKGSSGTPVRGAPSHQDGVGGADASNQWPGTFQGVLNSNLQATASLRPRPTTAHSSSYVSSNGMFLP